MCANFQHLNPETPHEGLRMSEPRVMKVNKSVKVGFVLHSRTTRMKPHISLSYHYSLLEMLSYGRNVKYSPFMFFHRKYEGSSAPVPCILCHGMKTLQHTNFNYRPRHLTTPCVHGPVLLRIDECTGAHDSFEKVRCDVVRNDHGEGFMWR